MNAQTIRSIIFWGNVYYYCSYTAPGYLDPSWDMQIPYQFYAVQETVPYGRVKTCRFLFTRLLRPRRAIFPTVPGSHLPIAATPEDLTTSYLPIYLSTYLPT